MVKSFKIFYVVIILCLLTGINVYAADYTAVIHGTYRHPITGVIEDSGGESKEALGQSMVDRIMPEKAYYEEVNGTNYLTFSLGLMNSISDVTFELDTGGGFTPTSYERIFDGDDTADMRVKVSSKESILRAKFFVEPMGRYVVFFIHCSDFVAGNSTSYPSLISHSGEKKTTEAAAVAQAVQEPVYNSEAAEADTGGITDSASYSNDMVKESSSAAAQPKMLPQNADSVIDNADGLYLGDNEQTENAESKSKESINNAASNSVMLDDSFWRTIFLLFITANLVSGIILIAFYYAVKIIYDNRRYKREKLLDMFSNKEDTEDFKFDDEFDDLEYENEYFDDISGNNQNEAGTEMKGVK